MSTHVPTTEQCLKIMDDVAMYENIRAHSVVVARVAEVVYLGLLETDAPRTPKRELVIAGSLLHDIAKTRCLKEGCLHAAVGAEMCTEMGYPDVAEIVANHVVLETVKTEQYTQGIFSAIELVYYADKRVRHDTIVTLDERLQYILTRYGNNDPQREAVIQRNFRQCQKIEDLLFCHLPFSSADIAGLVSSQPTELMRNTG